MEKEEKMDPVDEQYKGKEQLRTIYDRILEVVRDFGSDVLVKPKKSSVSVVRSRQFVLIKPATKKRIDLGFKLPEKPTTARLENSGSFGTMCTHHVQLTSVDQVDEELIHWMREAYDLAQ